jgi:hypothetical protein
MLTIVFSWVSIIVFAGGIKGILSNTLGEPLPYATIYIDEIQSGTTTNQSGFFEIILSPGTYNLVFQYMGYQTVSKRIQVGNDFMTMDVVLPSKSVELKSATIYAGKEDPAYTLMRKAIAKAPIHLQELNWYSAQVYMKGSGRLIDAPFFLRKKLAEEGLDSNTAFISETVTKVRYERPNTYKQEVISTRTSGSNSNDAQNSFVFSSFYQPEIAGVISPFSKKAFSYYRFKYVESFVDRGYTINKIQVVPRSKGDNVVEGYLYLVENDWNIYRINFVTYKEGIKVLIRGVYAPIEPKIWLPVTSKFDITGSYFGIEFEYKYIATIGDYVVEVNEDLNWDIEIIDEKIEKELAKKMELLDKQMDENQAVDSIRNKKSAKVTRKQLKKILKEYEEQDEIEEEEKDVVLNYNFKIDSLANKKDSAYWASVRSVPLDSNEIRGYQKLDSALIADLEEEKNDSIKKSTFSPLSLIFGHTFSLKDSSRLRVSMPMNFNTVDGFMLGARLRFRRKLSDSNLIQVTGETHYGFSRTALLGQMELKYLYGDRLARGSLSLSGGKMDVQINSDEPISPILNSLTSLFMQDNFMKLYETQYLKLRWAKYINTKWKVAAAVQYAERKHLENTTDFTFIKYHNRGYTANNPENKEYDSYQYVNQSSLLKLNAEVEFKPWQKLYVRNGKKLLRPNSSPIIKLRYTQGIRTEANLGGYSDYMIGFQHFIKVRGARRLRVNAYGGIRDFQGDSTNVDFIDFVHFAGNESPIVNSNPATQYRMLSYYGQSTSQVYGSVLLNYEFKKLLLTHLFFARMTGLKENLFANYLYTQHNDFHYAEFGYTLDNVFRVLRIEVVTNTLDQPFSNWAIRFGFTTNFSGGFSDD